MQARVPQTGPWYKARRHHVSDSAAVSVVRERVDQLPLRPRFGAGLWRWWGYDHSAAALHVARQNLNQQDGVLGAADPAAEVRSQLIADSGCPRMPRPTMGRVAVMQSNMRFTRRNRLIRDFTRRMVGNHTNAVAQFVTRWLVHGVRLYDCAAAGTDFHCRHHRYTNGLNSSRTPRALWTTPDSMAFCGARGRFMGRSICQS